MPRRSQQRLDYKKLHSTGERIIVERPVDEIVNLSSLFEDISLNNTFKMENILDQIQTIQDDIVDHIDEYPLNLMMHSAEDLDDTITKITQLRTLYRGKDRELHKFEDYENHASNIKTVLDNVKHYIKCANDLRHKLRMKDFIINQENKAKEEIKSKFILADTSRMLDEVEFEITIDFKDLSIDDVTRRKDELPDISKKVNNISLKMPSIIQEGDNELLMRYNKITALLSQYSQKLKLEFDNREVKKEKLFQESKLNIKLGKFKGYDSTNDIYCFKDDFMKVYSKSTPHRLMGDLIKNNHLDDPALTLVKSVDDIDDIFERLVGAYGDPKIILNKKLRKFQNIETLWKLKDPEKIADALSKIINLIRDLVKLSTRHNIEGRLYNSDAIDKIYKLIGDSRVTRWLTSICDDNIDDEETWRRLVKFLEKDLKVQQQKMIFYRKGDTDRQQKDMKALDRGRSQKIHYADEDSKSQVYENSRESPENLFCFICGETGHVATKGPDGDVIQYFSCKKFVEMTPHQRFKELFKKRLCFQCLLPGASTNDWKHKTGKCQRDYSCKHESHLKYPIKKHVMVCDEHKDTNDNKVLFQQYKDRCILRHKSADLPSFSKDIKLVFHSSSKDSSYTTKETNSDDVVHNRGIYLLQVINVDDQSYTIFYDSGCSDFVSRQSAIEKIGSRAMQECPGPIVLSGVGGIKTQSASGVYTVKLPLAEDGTATMTGVCLDVITETFPSYPLAGKVEQDIRDAYLLQNKDASNLPKLPRCVGGDVDFMMGIKYLRYHPKVIFQLPSGLTIYKSMFSNADGTRGVIGGPHEVFNAIHKHFNISSNYQSTFFSEQLLLYRQGIQIDPDISLLGYKSHQLDVNSDFQTTYHTSIGDDDEVYISRRIKLFQEVEEIGSTITYRCVNCRNCRACKDHDQLEEISIREEVEQDVINKSVQVDYDSRSTSANLPFMHDPSIKLAPNKQVAIKIYQQQVKKLNKKPKDKDDVINSEGKLQALGHVDFVCNLTTEQQQMLRNHPIQNFIPWRAVWKNNSMTTPCRLVYDASQATPSGYSLNDLLAKGKNNMNKLQEILIRWLTHKVAYHTDIQKMYNSIKLNEQDWCYQRYLWDENLELGKEPQEKVIKTLIYGVKSSGNQAEYGLRSTARLSKDDFPDVADVIFKDIYVDDCLSGDESKAKVKMKADQLEIVLNKGGFTLKGITYSGEDPLEILSDDQSSICVAGSKWFPKDDILTLDIGEMNFNKKYRGRKMVDDNSRKIPIQLTRRHCVSKVAEVYDLTGKVMPLVSSMKLDLHELVQQKLDWDDVLPDNLRPVWISNFEMIQEMKHLKYKRAVVPDDAINLNIDTLEFGDASRLMACAAIYARFERPNGAYSCQLVFARSKIIPEGTSQPRSELTAALLNAHTGEVVRRAFGSNHKNRIKLSDSEIVLYWLQNESKPLKQWVRNRVIEVRRFTEIDEWYHVDGNNMIADIGTRKGSTVQDVDQTSLWINGYDWMKNKIEDMPIRRVNDDNLLPDQLIEIRKEVPYSPPDVNVHVSKMMLQKDEILKRYEFSNYVIDPYKYRFETVVRIMALVLRFVRNLKRKTHKSSDSKFLNLTDDEVNTAKDYFYKKASAEIKMFNKTSFYKKFTTEKNEILYYTGRILSNDKVTIVGRFTDAMKDLCDSSFCVPVIDKFSPLAYSIINEIHWYNKDVMHRGVETVWREVMKHVFIIEGRPIVKMFRKSCERCRFLEKKFIDVAMGPVSKTNMVIAPPFYICQVDLAGPFQSYSQHHKRTTVKVWFAVFCCSTTSTVSLKLMEDYSSTAFIQAFVRLSCEFGYPKMLLPDEGSQLMKSCENMRFNFRDIQNKLHMDMKVEFDSCPVGGHNMHGRVERKIREVKRSIEKSFNHEKLSILQWETLAAEVANGMNNMPLALGNVTSDFEIADLITPNRLRIGRNNNRSPDGALTVTSNPTKFIKSNEKILSSWFETWLMCCIPKLMYQPKWFVTSHDLKKGDVVLFIKGDSSLNTKYQYGIVENVVQDRDGITRKANVKYQNASENVTRYTFRAVRELIVIHAVGDISIAEDLGSIAKIADLKFKNQK